MTDTPASMSYGDYLVSRIQAVMTLSWDVLATMTPSVYSSFRNVLGSSSGFQSAQSVRWNICSASRTPRISAIMMKAFSDQSALGAALGEPSLWDEANGALARAGFDLPPQALERDWGRRCEPLPAVADAWAQVCRGTGR